MRRWESNAGLFAVVKNSSAWVIEKTCPPEEGDELVHVPLLDSPARYLQGTFLSLHKDGGFDSERPGAFTVYDLSLAIAKILAAIIVQVAG